MPSSIVGLSTPCGPVHFFRMIEILGVWYPTYQIHLRRVLAKDWCSVLWQGAYPWKYARTPGNELLGWRCLEDLLKLQQVNLLRILDRSPLVPNGSKFLHNHIVITSDPHQQKCCPVHIQIKGVIPKICFNLTPDPSVLTWKMSTRWVEDWVPTPTRKPMRTPLLDRIPQDKDVWWSAASAEEGPWFFASGFRRKKRLESFHWQGQRWQVSNNWGLVKKWRYS